MIQPQDLRVGNLVYKIGESTADVYVADYMTIATANIYAPIPLTEEWLLKFRLIQRSDCKEMYLFRCVDSRAFALLLHQGEWRFIMEIGKTEGKWADISTIKYLHTLQNIWKAITGEELTLTNEEKEKG